MAPEMIPHLSTTKSPHMIVGSVLKNHFRHAQARCVMDSGTHTAAAAGACPQCERGCPR